MELLKSKVSIGILILCLLALITGACAKAAEDTDTLEDTTWILESYGEQGNLQVVLEDTEITAIFDGSEDRVRGSSGCNTCDGEYRINNNQLTIPVVACTEMACLEPEGIMEQEEQYLRAFQAAESYEIRDCKLRIIAGDQVLVFGAQEE